METNAPITIQRSITLKLSRIKILASFFLEESKILNKMNVCSLTQTVDQKRQLNEAKSKKNVFGENLEKETNVGLMKTLKYRCIFL